MTFKLPFNILNLKFVFKFREEDNFELDENDMNGVVEEVVDESKKGVFANRDRQI
jgi:hypothetical protein